MVSRNQHWTVKRYDNTTIACDMHRGTHLSGAINTAAFKVTDSEDELWRKLHEVMKERLGTTAIVYGFAHSVHLVDRVGFTRSLLLKNSHSDDYLSHFSMANFLEDDVSVAMLYDGVGPFLWHEIDNLPGLTDAQRQRNALDDALQLSAGVTLGFRFAGGRGYGGIGLASRGMSTRQFEEMWRADVAGHMAVLTAFDHLMRPAMVKNRLQLTRREKECLSLAVGGMTAKEIGLHLGIAEKSVFNILDRARKALHAASTIEAVAKALVYELI